MSLKKQSVCETIISSQTSVLLIESKKTFYNKLHEYAETNNILATIKSRNLAGKCQVKPYDIYVINCGDYQDSETQIIVEKILRVAPSSEIFLVTDCNEEKLKINDKYKKIASDLRQNQAVSDIIKCDENGLQRIIEAIQEVEYTKVKIHELWHKLEKA